MAEQPEVNVEKQELDELDTWFDDLEDDDEDQSAAEDTSDDEGTSPFDSSVDEVPDPQAPEVASSEEDNTTGTQDAPPAEADPYAWIEQLDPELRKHAESLRNRDQANSGRVAALTSRLDALQAEQEAQRAAFANAPSQTTGSPAETREVATDADLEEFMKEFPAVSENVQKMIDQRVSQVRSEYEQNLKPIRQAQHQERALAEKSKLREAASQIFNSAETGIQLEDVVGSVAWNEWMSAQPEGYRKYAGSATHAEDAAKVLEDFAAYSERIILAQMESEQYETPQKQDPDAGDAAQVAARRQEALQGSHPSSRSGDRGNVSKGGFDDWFDYFVENDVK